MPPSVEDRLSHILEAILSIEELFKEKTRADIAASRHSRAILEREIEIISEASRKLPEDLKAAHDDIDWIGMAAIGNRIRHADHLVDVEILLQVAEADLPPLKDFIERALKAGNEG
ncbi:DUF86 domain-containing protein [Microbacteriaceae bacterium K1510]|nr:DUF86 domain-containing protein [Microbacteriaceae bacterium K1510]